jgi:hypothetical protein
VASNQKSVDGLPLNTGDHRVEGIPGLYVRCGASVRSFFQQQRVDGVLVREYFGPVTVKRAKELAALQGAYRQDFLRTVYSADPGALRDRTRAKEW